MEEELYLQKNKQITSKPSENTVWIKPNLFYKWQITNHNLKNEIQN